LLILFIDSDPDSTPARLEELKEKFEPLLAFVKEHTFNVVREGTACCCI
jgi:hypothetical protein